LSEARLEALGAGRFRVVGDLDYETVDRLLQADDRLFLDAPPRVEVDLSAVRHTTSVGLALMLEWLRQARAKNIDIRFSHVPGQILGIARLSQLETILQLDDAE
jgi:phospholipid transport system transporter-binding protein